ncbi:MAG: hypothetical protein ABSG25_08900, partial [Bryobacteraceae bacterium]
MSQKIIEKYRAGILFPTGQEACPTICANCCVVGQASPLSDQVSRTLEIARNSVESQRLSTLIDYATAAPFAIDFLETAFAIEDSN